MPNTVPIKEVTTGILNIGRVTRDWVDSPRFGVPFLSGSDILHPDLSALPYISKRAVLANPLLILTEGTTLITRSGTIGRMAYCRENIAGKACTEHVLRVIPNTNAIGSGYLFAFLKSKYGLPLLVAGTYGGVIQHIEPSHLDVVRVPRLGRNREAEVHELITKSAKLLTQYASEIQIATKEFFSANGLKDITAQQWHDERSQDLGFAVKFPNPYSLRSLNFIPRAKNLWQSLEAKKHKILGDICQPNTLSRGGRYTRVDADKEFGVQLIGQKELFNLEPEGRCIARSSVGKDVFVDDGAILAAAQGTLGESELYCRSEFITGPWTQFAFSEHLLRIVAQPEVMPRGCLFAFLRSETAFRILRSISSGSKLQDNHYYFLPRIPVPTPSRKDMEAIDALVLVAYQKRHQAVALENQAIALIEAALDTA